MILLLVLWQLIAHPPPATPQKVVVAGSLTPYLRWMEKAPTLEQARSYVYRVSVPHMEVEGKPVVAQVVNIGCDLPVVPTPGEFQCFANLPKLVTAPGTYQLVMTAAHSLHESESLPSTPVSLQITSNMRY